LVGIPPAGRFFTARKPFRNDFINSVFRLILDTIDGDNSAILNSYKIAGAEVLKLGLDALRPDFILADRVQQDTAVGRGFGPSPFNMQNIVAERFNGAEIAAGPAFASQYAVVDRPDRGRVD